MYKYYIHKMSQSVINYDPPSQQIPNLRTVYKIPRGIAVIPSTIKLLDILINPMDASGNPVECYFPAHSGIWASIQQIELKVNDKPVDLFLSKQASAFKNSLGSPDLQLDITSQLTLSNNNIYQDSVAQNERLNYNLVDSISQCLEFRKVLDYLNNRFVIDEGLSIQITWDTQSIDWLLGGQVSKVNIQTGYLSYESVLDHNLPKQDVVNFKQTIEEAILIPNITQSNTVQQWEQRMNSLRGKHVDRVLFVFEPQNYPQDNGIANSVYTTFGRYCSIGQLNEFLNIVIDGSQKLTFKGFSNNAHKLGMCSDTFGISSSSMGSWYYPKYDILDNQQGQSMSNYYSYLGCELDTFVDKELVIQYNRNSSTIPDPDEGQNLQTFSNQLKVYMISEVWKQHDVQSGNTVYVKI